MPHGVRSVKEQFMPRKVNPELMANVVAIFRRAGLAKERAPSFAEMGRTLGYERESCRAAARAAERQGMMVSGKGPAGTWIYRATDGSWSCSTAKSSVNFTPRRIAPTTDATQLKHIEKTHMATAIGHANRISRAKPMTREEEEAAIQAFLRTKGATKCPTAFCAMVNNGRGL